MILITVISKVENEILVRLLMIFYHKLDCINWKQKIIYHSNKRLLKYEIVFVSETGFATFFSEWLINVI